MLAGALDIASGEQARKVLLGVAPTPRAGLALDLRGLTFMDSAGVRLVLQALERAEALGADFAVVRGGYAVQHVLELVGLADQLRMVDDPAMLERHADRLGSRVDGVDSPASW